jgi:hypothetical protein
MATVLPSIIVLVITALIVFRRELTALSAAPASKPTPGAKWRSLAAIQAETSSASLMALLRDGSDPPFGRICLVGALDGAWHGQATPKPDIGTAPGRNVNLNLASSIMRYSEQSKMVTAAP